MFDRFDLFPRRLVDRYIHVTKIIPPDLVASIVLLASYGPPVLQQDRLLGLAHVIALSGLSRTTLWPPGVGAPYRPCRGASTRCGEYGGRRDRTRCASRLSI